jgi:hypothetical protein
VGFVVAKVALEQVFLQLLLFSSVNIIPPWLSMLTYHRGDEQYASWWSHPIDMNSMVCWTFSILG